MPRNCSPTRPTASQHPAREEIPPKEANTNSVSDTATTQESDDKKMSRVPEGSENMINAANVVKLPQPFWREMPAQWFTIAEAAFALAKITGDEIKYRYVLVNLDPATLPYVSDIIANPPEHDKYGTIKRRMTETFGESHETKLRKLLRGHEIGDEKPSVFLQRIRNMAAGQVSDNVLRTLFLEQLPNNIRSILAISQVEDITQLALQADKIVEVSKPQVMALSAKTDQPDEHTRTEITVTELKAMIEELAVEVRRGRTKRGTNSRGRRQRSYSNRRSRDRRSNNNFCYYHRRFGEDARNCEEPCAWKKQIKQAKDQEN
ncbi:uncharacterized protein LOC112452578 [Temnothorax curvispinosus]|uniref:Uncharacterized protein LOC112452578 n=1 Tax=Temnothorax curvispinosus TaxID=300111 RepID=A0A6J1PGX8_9HYME|nr:uncharacterized protein LOC112452578 [Temnothorax curvispinosus]